MTYGGEGGARPISDVANRRAGGVREVSTAQRVPPVRPTDPIAAEPALRALLGADRVRVDGGARTAYAIDATPLHHGVPDLVVFPRSTAEVAGVLRIASEHRVPVVPRGAGTNLSAATVPHLGGIVLVLTGMDQMRSVDAENLLLVTQPGVTVAMVQAAAAEHGLLYAPDPASGTTATIGGNVATCAGGLRGLKYGVTSDYLVGVEAVLASGEVIRCGGEAVRDAAGYDLVRLLCGSEGTLAVITEITLRLLPQPEATGVGLAYFDTLAAAGGAATDVLRSGVLPSMLEFLDRTCLRAVAELAPAGRGRGAGALLVFGQDGDDPSVRRDVERIAESCRRAGALDVQTAFDEPDVGRLLEARRSTLPALARLAPLTVLEDVTVPRARIPEMVARIERIAADHEVLIATFGHAGDGNLHPTCILDPDEGDGTERMRAAFGEIFDAAVAVGGTITGEHGVGLAKRPYLERRLGAEHVALLRRIKQAFDPLGILNPGKLGG
jgi:glycolate oxidase